MLNQEVEIVSKQAFVISFFGAYIKKNKTFCECANEQAT